MTTLRVNGIPYNRTTPKKRTTLIWLETTGLRFKPPTILLGDVYVARLNKANYAFRLDIDREIQIPQRLEAVEKLLGNDLYAQSYPETLRLSHILCNIHSK